MVSFDNFAEMYRFAREVDEGIKCLEDQVKNPEQLRYGDKKADERAHLCSDSIEEEILNIEADVRQLLERETEELQMLIEERDEFAKYVSDVEAGLDDFKNMLAPYGYEHRQPKNRTPMNTVPSSSSSLLPSGSSLLENMSFPLTHTDVSTYKGDNNTYNNQNTSACGDCSTPELFEKQIQSYRNNGKPVVNYTVENFDAADGGRMGLGKDNNITTANRSNSLLSQTYIYSPSASGLSNLSHVNTTFSEKVKLKNDIQTPKPNILMYKSIHVTTPPDPGFSSISQQVYRLRMGRLKQANINKETEN